MSEQMPEITDEDARVLEELVELAETDPEGYQALIGDLGGQDDPARAHAEELLQMLTTRSNEERQFTELLNAAYRQRAEEGNQP
jgi:hypothetical protein